MKLKRLALVLIGFAIGLLIAEGGTRLAESKLKNVQVSGAYFGQVQTITDPKLGLRVVPNSPGHDANGFRNSSVLPHADVVAIGDSQTWGQNVNIDDAWPQKLGHLLGTPVYNMGINGYGPLEYLVLSEEALKTSPKVLVIGLYFGNDLWDAYHTAYTRAAFADLRDRQLTASLQTDVVGDKARTISERTDELSESLRRNSNWGVFEWLAHHTAIGRQLSSRGRWPGQTASAKEAALRKAMTQFPAYGVVYDSERCRTILTTSYRLAALDRNEVRILEGLRITKLALAGIQELTRAHDVRLIVLLIPTKELVYANGLTKLGKVDRTYASLIEMETADRNEIKTFCDSEKIEIADALPTLRLAVTNDVQIYPEGADGHPNAAGYAVIADAVKARLNQ